jgi:hypothetical protein
MTTTYPPLTAEEFTAGAAYTIDGLPLIEDESGSWVFTYGHADPEQMAAAVNQYDVEIGGVSPADATYQATDVQQRYAVTVKPKPEWFINWATATAETPGSFPVTVVAR